MRLIFKLAIKKIQKNSKKTLQVGN